MYLKLFIIVAVLIGIAMLGMAVRILFSKKAEFSGGSCQSSPELNKRGITCGCGGGTCQNQSETNS